MYLPEFIWALRNRLLGSAAFQRAASAFPLTRGISRRRARDTFDLVAGFVYSQVLLACVQLELFAMVAAEPQTAEALAPRLQLSLPATQRLLVAAVSLGLLDERPGERYGLGFQGAVIHGNPGILAMIRHHALLYEDLRDPVALLRGEAGPGRLGEFWPYANAASPGAVDAGQVAAYSRLMSSSQTLVVDEILGAYPLNRHRCLLDLGGGDGRFATSAAQACPQLQVRVFDLPAVAELARQRFAAANLGERASAFGGDFLRDPIPAGADIISLVRVLHDHDDERVLTILRAARAALPDDGSLLIAEPLSGTSGAEAMADAYFGFYLLAMGRGQARRPARLAQMLEASGFMPPRLIPTRIPLQTSVLLAAVRPGSRSVNPA